MPEFVGHCRLQLKGYSSGQGQSTYYRGISYLVLLHPDLMLELQTCQAKAFMVFDITGIHGQ